MEVITAAADTRAAATAMGVLFLEMMFRLEDEAIAKRKEKEPGGKGWTKTLYTARFRIDSHRRLCRVMYSDPPQNDMYQTVILTVCSHNRRKRRRLRPRCRVITIVLHCVSNCRDGVLRGMDARVQAPSGPGTIGAWSRVRPTVIGSRFRGRAH